jgi:hypothetical protein
MFAVRWPRFRFRLRTTLIIFAVAAVPLGWWVNVLREERAAAAQIERAGGDVSFWGQFARERNKVGWRFHTRAIFPRVVRVTFQDNRELGAPIFGGRRITDEDLAPLQKFRWLDRLRILSVVDAEVEITPAGLRKIAELQQLTHLDLTGVRMSDADVPIFYGMTRLDSICLPDYAVSDKAAEKLQEHLPRVLIMSHNVGWTAAPR